MRPPQILNLLEDAAAYSSHNSIVAYSLGASKPREIRYDELRALAVFNGKLLRRVLNRQEGSIVLIHFEDHLENIIWLWSTIYAGYVPAMSTAFPRDTHHCEKHLAHLKSILDDPICLTRSSLMGQFPTPSILTVLDVDDILHSATAVAEPTEHCIRQKNKCTDLALLMLTSGSTGNAKAVCLTHSQISASVAGKASMLPIRAEDNDIVSFLNWIRLDHVGSLIEIHMHALFVGVSQVHVQPEDIIATPTLFLERIHHHRVVRTFAPNFFLCELARVLESGGINTTPDLSCLEYIVSGGEANLVETCVRISQLLAKYGARDNVIVPGFGMTETCAGSIYSLACPSYDVTRQHEFASLGYCVPGIEMRVSGPAGSLEIRGPIVFPQYYNNELATAEAFTPDGWFKTGDTAKIDATGRLCLSGRTKELISINGVKFLPIEVQGAIEEGNFEGITPGYVVCFATRPAGAPTEQVAVIYLPTYAPDNIEMRYQTQASITKAVLAFTSSRPYILPLEERHLQRTALGKLSGSKLRLALESGEYCDQEAANDLAVKTYQEMTYCPPEGPVEEAILEELEKLLDIPQKTIGVDAMMFEHGLTSVDLMKLKKRIEQRLQLNPDDIPIITLMKNPTVRGLANALQESDTPQEYNPVVTLNSQGTKTPLWLIHPGVGEILVFLGLSTFITERPVYALRARGFNDDESHFLDIAECVATYHAAIKKKQPRGPYALAGYSYGSMLAFEVSKALEEEGDEVRFVGCFNLPPHIKFRMRQLDWTECLLHLAFFLDLMTEDHAQIIRPDILDLPKSDAIVQVIKASSVERLTDLSITAAKLERWASLAYGLQSMARDYDPSGSVGSMDVFYCEPLTVVASSKQQWLEDHLHRWRDFVRNSEVKYHDVAGHHYTMLSPLHVRGFQATLRKALVARGL
ncbi:acetyl-CoA synthetase-like protein [Penicillium longicatenatum]|uniref:acetyl-CoA synthetase-like protein n=1 Tax=Penicillium longicatenatum TaxID=1561947 RepID=UPI002548F774|nr:acetyl-CoA synthetase-like protein [Penicillium longicatenatum]KAJ5631503.1 acetyl-CoA synthetase-like protein [Penicillium longicatenatum]